MNRPLPFNKDAECKILGTIFYNPLVLKKLTHLHPEDFYDVDRATLYSIILEQDLLRKPIDSNLIVRNDQFDLATQSMLLAEVLEDFVPEDQLERYVSVVKDTARKRRLIKEAVSLIDILSTEKDHEIAIEKAEKIIHNLSQRSSNAMTLETALKKAIAGLNSLHKEGHLIKTHMSAIDTYIRGFEPGQLIIIGARPSMGKTALALCIAHNIIKQGLPVGFFTIEMTNEQMSLRSLALETGMSMDQLYNKELFTEYNYFNHMIKGADTIKTYQLYLDDVSRSVMDIRAQARLWKQQGVKAIFIDYLGLIKSKRQRESKNVEIADISADLKDLAKEIRLPLIVLCQLNRSLENRSDQRPRLSDLRDSGAIEQDADIIMFLYRDAYYHKDLSESKAELIIQKNRNGQLATVMLEFEPKLMKFS